MVGWLVGRLSRMGGLILYPFVRRLIACRMIRLVGMVIEWLELLSEISMNKKRGNSS